jgi:protein TonB
MNPSNPHKDLLDLLYEGKNKAYGAYDLQHKNKGYTASGLLISMVAIFTLFAMPMLIAWFSPEPEAESNMRIVRVIDYSELSAPPPIERNRVEPPPELPKMKPKPTVKKYVAPVVKPDEEVPDEEEVVPTQEELKTALPGTESIEGDSIAEGDWIENYDVATEPEVKEPVPLPPPPPPKKEEALNFVEIMPEFPGGAGAYYKFLQEHIVYPPKALSMGIQGRVYLKFVVEKDGSVTDIRIAKGIGFGLNEEALRVVNKMPNWTPGVQNGRNVRVTMHANILFKIHDE